MVLFCLMYVLFRLYIAVGNFKSSVCSVNFLYNFCCIFVKYNTRYIVRTQLVQLMNFVYKSFSC